MTDCVTLRESIKCNIISNYENMILTLHYYFRCIVDSTFEYIQMEDPKTKRFTLKAFHFMSSDSVVYLHAFVKICNASIEK